jgi:hypothetical protein
MKSFILLVFILMAGCQQNQHEENEKREPQTPRGKYMDSLFVIMNNSLDSMKSWVQELIDTVNAGGELDTLILKRITDEADSVIARKSLAMDSLPHRFGMDFESWYRMMAELDRYFKLIEDKFFWYKIHPDDGTKARLMRALQAAKEAKDSLEHHMTQGGLDAAGRQALEAINEHLQRTIDSLAVDRLNPVYIKSMFLMNKFKRIAANRGPPIFRASLEYWYVFLNELDRNLEAIRIFADMTKNSLYITSRDELKRYLGYLKKIIESAKSAKGSLEMPVKLFG